MPITAIKTIRMINPKDTINLVVKCFIDTSHTFYQFFIIIKAIITYLSNERFFNSNILIHYYPEIKKANIKFTNNRFMILNQFMNCTSKDFSDIIETVES
jgi:hypothetical protein